MTSFLMPRNRISTVVLALAVVTGLSACGSIGYRCPLDPNETPDSPTACAGMRESLEGAKQGTGSKISVLLDEKGRLVSKEQRENKPAAPLIGQLPGAPEPYRNNSGEPVFEQSRVYQAWTPAFVDAEGNLHDGHHSWFATPGRWSYGSTRDSGAVGDSLMRPSMPSDRPEGKVIPADARGQARTQAQPKPSATSFQDRDKAALQNLSSAATTMTNKPAVPAAGGTATPAPTGVTAPAINLTD